MENMEIRYSSHPDYNTTKDMTLVQAQIVPNSYLGQNDNYSTYLDHTKKYRPQ